MTPVLFYDDVFLGHDTGSHPENAHRLRAIRAHLQKTGLWRNVRAADRVATPEEIACVHDPRYIQACRQVSERGGGALDLDTVMSSGSYEAAVRAVGALLQAADAVMDGEGPSALCLVRPPGHHALPAEAMGFCIFNNVAVAARHLQRRHGLKRIAIVDWDVHHGNGTQDVFYEDPSVLFFSIHRFPFYPGTGGEGETGAGRAVGTKINRPVSHDTDAEEYIAVFEEVLRGPVREFRPECVLISAGFDAHAEDPIGGLSLRHEDFGKLTGIVREVAEATCGGRIISTLEGGYNLDALPLCVESHLRALGA